MHEVLIKVCAVGDYFTVNLFTSEDGQPVGDSLAQGNVPKTWLTHGLKPDKPNENLTADKIITSYADGNALPNVKDIGTYLYQMIAPGDVGTRWEELRSAHRTGLATYLDLADAQWRSLPWELLYSTSRPSFIQQKAKHPIFQYHDVPHESCTPLPLRVLVVVGCDTSEDGQDENIKWREELALLRYATTRFPLRFDINVLKAPLTRQDIVTELANYQPHVIHFIGHGIQQDDDDGSLLLWSGTQNKMWHVHEINNDLDELNIPPRMAYINACLSAGLPDAGVSIADCFTKLNCGAVIAMRGEVRGDVAACFSGAFYCLLAEDGLMRPDKAFSGARAKTCRIDGLSDSDIDWSLPRISFRCPPSKLFHTNTQTAIDEKHFESDAELGAVKVFINRENERRKLINDVKAWLCNEQHINQVALLHGPREVGKSSLAKALLVAACLNDFRVFYWDFSEMPLDKEEAGLRNYDAEDLLHSLRRGSKRESCFRKPWNDAHFESFDALWSADGGVAQRGDENWLGETYEAFARGLAASSAEKPILLVLDSYEKISPDHWNRYLAKQVVTPASQGDIESLNIFLVGGDRNPSNHSIPTSGVFYQDIGLFPSDKLGSYVFDLALHYSDIESDTWLEVADELAALFEKIRGPQLKAGWQPSEFDKARSWLVQE